jgi:hypothetical protein
MKLDSRPTGNLGMAAVAAFNCLLSPRKCPQQYKVARLSAKPAQVLKSRMQSRVAMCRATR